MNRQEAIAIACTQCVDAASMLSAVHLGVEADEHAVAQALAASVVCGWGDLESTGRADARGIVVQPKGETVAYQVRWTEVAAVIGPALRSPGIAEQLDEVYRRYVDAAASTRVADRLAAWVASAELTHVRRKVLDLAAQRLPVQQSLFPDRRARSRTPAR